MPNASPRLLLADCDQMFVAVARLVDPEGAGRAPLLVVGGAANSRGVVCSASYEVRAFGVRSGMSIAKAVRLCPNATFVPVPRKACGQKSRQIREVLEQWAPKVEPASIDEFYLDLSGTEALYHYEPLEATAAKIRSAVLAVTGMTVSFGGGTNRLVAKLAAERAKPKPSTGATGVYVVPPGQEAAFLATHALADLPGVGPRLTATLAAAGLRRVPDALRLTEGEWCQWIGERTGRWLYRRIRGEGSVEVEPHGDPKSMSREETFPADINDQDRLETELLRLTTRLAADLREEGLRARCVTVKLRDFDFTTRQASRTLEAPFASDRVAFETARDLLRGLRAKRKRPARLLGVGFSRFEGGDPRQLDLLGAPPTTLETARDQVVARAVDQINRRFGTGALAPARLTAGKKTRAEPR